MPGKSTEPRTGTPDPKLAEGEFKRRFRAQFQDPAFAALGTELERLGAAAWEGYCHHRKSPRTRKAGPGFADPAYELAVDWIAAREAIHQAQAERAARSQARFLIVNCSPRSEHSCPGEMSKSYRLLELAVQMR